MSTKILAALFALSVGAALLGCRAPHLGDDTGRAYRRAINDQAEAGAKTQGSGLSADDARAVLSVHRQGGKPSLPGAAGSTAGAVTTTTSTSSSSSSGSWPGATGPISLEAK
ncbi:MAG TPA: hypothetical protein VL172_08775 [Kofleriaceae bacterium]|nr:hypothetical protein [Kofleriaceae bacterium]